MGADRSEPILRPIHVYVGALTVSAVVILFWATTSFVFSRSLFPWFVLTLLFVLSESLLVVFHHEHGRQSVAPSEALVFPMLVALSSGQFVWSVAVGMALVRIVNRKEGWLKGIFNVAQYVCAASIAAAVWQAIGASASQFRPLDAAALLLAAIVYSVFNYVFVAGAIALSQKEGFYRVLVGVASAAGINFVISLSLGLLFASAYYAAPWSVLFFTLPLGGAFFGFRALVRQDRARERVEQLHAASRELAANPDLRHALIGFLGALREIAACREARVIIKQQKQWLWSGVSANGVTGDMIVADDATVEFVGSLAQSGRPLVIAQDGRGRVPAQLAEGEIDSLIAVSLTDENGPHGALLAINRVGVEEFGNEDARLLEALANELVITLESYQLFAQVVEERERFQRIFAGSKEGICLLDEAGLVRAWNPALARITGFSEDDMLGRDWSDRLVLRDRYHRRIEGLDLVAVPTDEELELVTREGPPRWIAVMSGEVPSEDEKSWVVLVRDITAEHEVEESKSDFLSTISHELRTPLTTIKGSLQVLSRPSAGVEGEIGGQMIAIMKRGTDRLERLVMNLLAVSQMEAGELQVFPDELRLIEIVQARIESILPDRPQVTVTGDEDIVVRADRERLGQVVDHVLDNARKFGAESGRIEVEIVKENGFARVSIRDEGPGIPKIDQERIFDRFVRLGHVLTRETQGPGVGLFIVKRSLEAMGGSVSVESEPERGATFHLRIPLAHPMAAIESSA